MRRDESGVVRTVVSKPRAAVLKRAMPRTVHTQVPGQGVCSMGRPCTDTRGTYPLVGTVARLGGETESVGRGG